MIAFGAPARRLFSLESGTVFVNHGSFGAPPRSVTAAAARWRSEMEKNPDRFMREKLPGALRAAAERLAATFRAQGDHLAFVENATAGANTVLRSLKFRRGDEILFTSHAYGAVRQAARYVCRRSGATLVEARIRLPVSGAQDLIGAIEDALNRKTRLLIVDHIASPTGLVFPVKRLAALARARGVPVLVDGAHAPGQIALDIPSLGVDWYVGNCHKWLFAPRGCAFLWSRKPDVKPLAISHGYGKGFTAEFDWTGTRDFSAWLAITDSLDFLRGAGAARVRRYCHSLAVQAGAELSAAWNQPLDGPAGLHAAMVAVRLPRSVGDQLRARLLRNYGIVAAITKIDGAAWCRVSAQIYNTRADYARLRDAVLREASLRSRRSRE